MATIEFQVPYRQQAPAVLLPKVAALVIDHGEAASRGVEIVGDVTVLAADHVLRTMTLTFLPRGLAIYNTPELREVEFKNLYKAAMDLGVPTTCASFYMD